MEKVIIFKNEAGGVSIIHPATNCTLTTDEIAKKDTPKGRPYRIVNFSDLPSDQSMFDAWEANFDAPDGFGVGQLEWLNGKGL